MNNHQNVVLTILSGMILCILLLQFELPRGNAALNAPPAAPSNVNVVNNPAVHVMNMPTVRIQEHNWQYRAVVIPKAFPGTPEWNNFVEQLNGLGQQGWELVNIAESVALLKKST